MPQTQSTGFAAQRIGASCRHDRALSGALTLAFIAFALAMARPAPAQPYAYVSGSFNNSLAIVDTSDDSIVGSPIPVGTNPFGAAVTPNGARVFIANGSSDNVSVLATSTNTVIATIPVGDRPTSVAVTSNGAWVFVGNIDDDSISVINAATNTIVGSPIVVGDQPASLAITPNGRYLYVANLGGSSVSVIDTATRTVIKTILSIAQPLRVAVTPDGKRVYVVNSSDKLTFIDTATNTVLGTVTFATSFLRGLAINAQGNRLYVAQYFPSTDEDQLLVLSLPGHTVVGTIPLPRDGVPAGFSAQVTGIALTPDDAKAYVSMQNTGALAVIDTASNTLIDSYYPGVFPSVSGQFILPALVFNDGFESGNFSVWSTKVP